MNMAGPHTKVELFLRCNNLPNLDLFSKTDCCVFAYFLPPGVSMYNQQGIYIAQTETIRDNLNPEFSRPIRVDYFFEQEQRIQFLLLDIDKENGKEKDQDFIGTVTCTLAQIVSAKNQRLTRQIMKKNGSALGKSELVIAFEEVLECKAQFKLALAASVPKKNLLARPDPFYIIYRNREDGTKSEVPVFTSDRCKNTTEPIWGMLQMGIQEICNTDKDRSLTIKIFDWEGNGDHIYIGEFSASVNELCKTQKFTLVKYRDAKDNKNVGIVEVKSASVVTVSSFLDYIRNGLQISLTIAVDFTSSNGDPNDPSSLHFRSNQHLNPYQYAILSVGPILEEYDTDKVIPTFGFGAKLPDGQVSHKWALNGEPASPGCRGIDGVMNAYNLALRNITLWGPTNFSPVITSLAEDIEGEMQTRRTQSNLPWTYHVLLIITDGEITDMESTVRAIVRASSLPLSIVIVGVGKSAFENMQILDGDQKRLQTAEGVHANRDIVQFFSLESLCAKQLPPDLLKAELAKATLEEIPYQIIEYFNQKGIKPQDMQRL